MRQVSGRTSRSRDGRRSPTLSTNAARTSLRSSGTSAASPIPICRSKEERSVITLCGSRCICADLRLLLPSPCPPHLPLRRMAASFACFPASRDMSQCVRCTGKWGIILITPAQPTELENPWAIIEDFRKAALNAKKAGFDGVECSGPLCRPNTSLIVARSALGERVPGEPISGHWSEQTHGSVGRLRREPMPVRPRGYEGSDRGLGRRPRRYQDEPVRRVQRCRVCAFTSVCRG
jgi:hypothetical protein